MKRRRVLWGLAAAPLALLGGQGPASSPASGTPAGEVKDPLLSALLDELERARSIRIGGLDAPYYIFYGCEDIRGLALASSLGALVRRDDVRFRSSRVEVRVGSHEFDNANYVLSDYGGSSRFDLGELPLDNDYAGLRREYWLITDRLFKAAVEIIARKRSALKNVTVREQIPDYTPAEAVKLIGPRASFRINAAQWEKTMRELSAVFTGYPEILDSRADFNASISTTYQTNTDGSVMRFPEGVCFVRLIATSQAADGMPVRDACVMNASEAAELPSAIEMRRQAVQCAENVKALLAAPVAEDYSGPVLMEGTAAAQLLAHLLGDHLALPRRPVSEPGRPVPFTASDLEGRQGSRILPEFINVVDDPTQKQWRGRPLFGHYLADMECVRPVPLDLVVRGELKNYLLTRTPVRGFGQSNGRARLPGSYGAKRAAFGNLFVQASESSTPAAMKKQMLEICEKRGKPHGILLRKLDFPYSGSIDELRRISASGGRGDRLAVLPLLAYRVYPDGREELVRGLKFRNLTVRSLRDILAASDDETLFEYIGNNAPLSMMGGGGYVTTHSVVAPALLFDDLELDRRQEDWPKLPLVPPPPVSGAM